VHVCRGNFLARSHYSAPPTRSWHGIERGCTLTFLFCFSVNMRRTCRPTFPSSSAASSWPHPGPADPCTCSTTRAVGITMSWSHACPYICIYVNMYVLIVQGFDNFTLLFFCDALQHGGCLVRLETTQRDFTGMPWRRSGQRKRPCRRLCLIG
jgi:hypothetical protein